MSTVDPKANSAKNPADVGGAKPGASYRCHIAIVPEEDGDFSVIVLNLPGTGSSGATESEAIENCKEAIQASLESYRMSGGPIPWATDYDSDIPSGAKRKWIQVNA